MIAAGVQVVSLAHLVGEVAVVVMGIDVAHEALLPAAVRAGELTGLVARQAPAL